MSNIKPRKEPEVPYLTPAEIKRMKYWIEGMDKFKPLFPKRRKRHDGRGSNPRNVRSGGSDGPDCD
jgi:hypothetical protein